MGEIVSTITRLQGYQFELRVKGRGSAFRRAGLPARAALSSTLLSRSSSRSILLRLTKPDHPPGLWESAQTTHLKPGELSVYLGEQSRLPQNIQEQLIHIRRKIAHRPRRNLATSKKCL